MMKATTKPAAAVLANGITTAHGPIFQIGDWTMALMVIGPSARIARFAAFAIAAKFTECALDNGFDVRITSGDARAVRIDVMVTTHEGFAKARDGLIAAAAEVPVR